MATTLPPQHQAHQPGRQGLMRPEPETVHPAMQRGDLLRDKRVVITGGDSGIGRAVAVACAMQGADVAILYKEEDDDAAVTRRQIEEQGRKYVGFAGDVGDEAFCREKVDAI